MNLRKFQIILILFSVCLHGFSQKSSDLSYEIYYENGDFSQYLKTMQLRIKAMDIKLLNYKVDTVCRKIVFDINTDLNPNSLKTLFSVDNKFGFYSTVNRDSLKKIVSNEYYSSVALDMSMVPEHTYISNELIGYTDSLYYHSLNKLLILLSTFYKDSQANKYLIYFLDISNLSVSESSFSSIEIKKGQYNSYYNLCIKFNELAGNQWSQFTESNINKTVAIVIDKLILSAPKVQSKISGGNICMILENENDAKIFKSILSFPRYNLDIKKVDVAYILDLK